MTLKGTLIWRTTRNYPEHHDFVLAWHVRLCDNIVAILESTIDCAEGY